MNYQHQQQQIPAILQGTEANDVTKHPYGPTLTTWPEIQNRGSPYHPLAPRASKPTAIPTIGSCCYPICRSGSVRRRNAEMLNSQNYNVSNWDGVCVGILGPARFSIDTSYPVTSGYSRCSLDSGVEVQQLWCKKVKSGWPLVIEYIGTLLGVNNSGCHWGSYKDDMVMLTRFPGKLFTLVEYEKKKLLNSSQYASFCKQVALATLQLVLGGQKRISRRNFIVTECGEVHACSNMVRPSKRVAGEHIEISSSIIGRYFSHAGGLSFLAEVLAEVCPSSDLKFEIYSSAYSYHLAPEDSEFIQQMLLLRNAILSGQTESIFGMSAQTPTTSPSYNTNVQTGAGVQTIPANAPLSQPKQRSRSGCTRVVRRLMAKVAKLSISRIGNNITLHLACGTTLTIPIAEGESANLELQIRGEVITGATAVPPSEKEVQKCEVIPAPVCSGSEVQVTGDEKDEVVTTEQQAISTAVGPQSIPVYIPTVTAKVGVQNSQVQQATSTAEVREVKQVRNMVQVTPTTSHTTAAVTSNPASMRDIPEKFTTKFSAPLLPQRMMFTQPTSQSRPTQSNITPPRQTARKTRENDRAGLIAEIIGNSK